MRQRRGLICLFLGTLAFLSLFAHGYIENTDGEIALHGAWAWRKRGSPALHTEGVDVAEAERLLAAQIHAGAWFGKVGRDGDAFVIFPIGHQALLIPAIWLGEALAELAPAPERRLREMRGPLFGDLFWARFVASFLPVGFAAGSVVVIFVLVRGLGLAGAEALAVTAVATLGTAFWPGSSETTADAPGMFFLMAQAAITFAYCRAPGKLLATASIAAGSVAVLLRYPHLLAAAVLAGGVALAALRTRRFGDLSVILLSALPGIAAMAFANWFRFGDVRDTGYGAGADAAWWSYPMHLGVPLILLAPGKGILWFSPPLWSALAQTRRAATAGSPSILLMTWLCLLLPLSLHGHTAGWAAGQCWSIRYLTPAVVLFVAVHLALGQPWRRSPRRFGVLCAVALLVSIGGVITPYRGDRQLAEQAAAVLYPEDPRPLLSLRYDFAPQLSPLHSHFVYAWLSAAGRLELGGSQNTTEPLFGVVVPATAPDLPRPTQPEDIRFRHWWWRYGADLFGWSPWCVLPVAVAAVLLLLRAISLLRVLPALTNRGVPVR